MPASATSSAPIRTANPNTTQKAQTTTRTKKSRVVRRRGRARDGIESDDEIERVVSTDTESDSDESLSLDSATDSEQESASEDELPDRQISAHTPNTSHSPGAPEKDAAANGKSAEAFFSTTGNWSEMVADENANGAADLPVIEFSDFKADDVPTPQPPTRKPRKANKKRAPVPPPISAPISSPKPSTSAAVDGDVVETVDQATQESPESPRQQPSQPRRPVGQSARQAYQQKLENDPSFVPKVGGFWGHDDRLMDKDLRSLSGWWRGRWQGRGRGRGGFVPGNVGRGPHASEAAKEENVSLPPIERTWTHDGFEEMKRKEESRPGFEPQRQTNPSLRGAARGRGGSVATRGGRGGPRGGFVNSGNRAAAAAKAGRVWYAMKPEHMWTKQSENFLFFESHKYRAPGATYRVQLPGSWLQVIKTPPPQAQSQASNHIEAATASVVGSDVGDTFVIKLPNRFEEEPPTTVDETSLEDVFKVRPRLVNTEPIPLPAPSNTKSSPGADKPTHRSHSATSTSVASPDPAVRSQLEQLSMEPPSTDPARWAQTEQAVLRKPTGEAPAEEADSGAPASEDAPRRPSLPPIQTVYSPPPTQPSPAYPSSYGYPALPPGIALNQHGMPYELATGRPVYLSSTAPPMYNPRPIMHSHIPQHSISYMPHMHPSSTMSPDFAAHQPRSHSHTPSVTAPVNGFIDPATGLPMFSLPRSSRVEIRAPGTGEDSSKSTMNGGAKASVSPGPSHLRASSTSYANSPSHPGAEYGYHSYSSSSDVSTLPSYAPLPEAGASSEPPTDATPQPMMPYAAYQQYYYPEAAYGYPQYMDMSQVGQYEMYPPMEAHGTTYY
ncbi:hypothetical protein P691DRAFT_757998 [Macrolepiota fuliginosa MF-IS2]|uniref:Btz domain-containing protein n=1 Tax=Macrolepiota fuliginosa MF-IS2 TaxID=1400762 RepID=A0A9P5XHZ5_9AGAR|nr:hypothetical protein P691DRAFT_757998 [Macrolepiota fuliginosa MF-IS2]